MNREEFQSFFDDVIEAYRKEPPLRQPVFLSPKHYEIAASLGIDMTGYRITRPIPTLMGTRPDLFIIDDIAADQHSTTERKSMTRVSKNIRLLGHTSDKNLNGNILLASVDSRQFLNLNVSDYTGLGKYVGLTLSQVQAKQLRDELLAIYPVEAKPVAPIHTPIPVGSKVRVITKNHGELQFGDEGVVVKNNRPNSSLSYEVNFGVPGATKKQYPSINQYREGELEVIAEFTKNVPVTPAAPATSGWVVGAKVRRNTGSRKGQIMTITGVSALGYDIRVDGMTGWRMRKYFDLVTVEEAKKDETGSFIVTLKEGSDYKPSGRPIIHYTRSKAEAEAARLAKEHGGAFHVLKAVHVASRPTVTVPPVTAHDL